MCVRGLRYGVCSIGRAVHRDSRIFWVPLLIYLHPWLSEMGTVKILIRLHECANAQADLNLRRAHMSAGIF